MNENRNANGFNDAAARGCGRAEDLVAYLYGEARADEADSFRRHLSACTVCREELAAFGGVRAGVAEWRADVLSAAPSLDLGGALAQEPTAQALPARAPAVRQRSALAALREFFSLAPLWLRAGAVAAALAVCALTTFTLLRTEIRWDSDGLAFRTGVPASVVAAAPTSEAPTPSGYTQQQVEAIVWERVRQELAAAEQSWKEQQEQRSVINVQNERAKKEAPRLQLANSNKPQRKRVAPRNPRPEERYLDDDESLPRLSDLLNGTY